MKKHAQSCYMVVLIELSALTVTQENDSTQVYLVCGHVCVLYPTFSSRVTPVSIILAGVTHSEVNKMAAVMRYAGTRVSAPYLANRRL